MTWASWFAAGIVPGLCSIIVVPWLVMKLHPLDIRRTPEAPEFARKELAAMGRMSGHEVILAIVFVSVCVLWVTAGWHRMDISVVALLGAVSLLITGVLDWEDVRTEKAAWDIFIWYGGVVRLGRALGETGPPSSRNRSDRC